MLTHSGFSYFIILLFFLDICRFIPALLHAIDCGKQPIVVLSCISHAYPYLYTSHLYINARTDEASRSVAETLTMT